MVSVCIFFRRELTPKKVLLHERTMDVGDEEGVGFSCGSSSGDMSLNPLLWWLNSTSRCLHVPTFSKDILEIQGTSFGSKSPLSCSENLISDRRSLLEHAIISACMCSRSWTAVVETSHNKSPTSRSFPEPGSHFRFDSRK